MARSALIAGVAAGAAALGASAMSGAAGTGGAAARAAANEAPVASLRVKHRRVPVGRKVLLDSSRSRDPDGRVVYHLWDLDGDGVYERDSGRRARIRHTFRKTGKVSIGVLVVDDGGAYATRRARLRVVADESPRNGARAKHARKGHHRARVHAATRSAKQTRVRPAAKSSTTDLTPPSTTLHTAAAGVSKDVKMVDYKFKPPSITVNVGDTVVWTNDGALGHTATADDGSFDTGLLSKGATGSYKFTKAGKFAYHCTPHTSFMKATVTVTESGGNSSSGSGSNNSGGSGSNSSSNSSLPHTGLPIGSVFFAGFVLLCAGAALRRGLTHP